MLVRKGSPDDLKALQGINSSYDLLEKVKRLASIELQSEGDEDEDFEDYL